MVFDQAESHRLFEAKGVVMALGGEVVDRVFGRDLADIVRVKDELVEEAISVKKSASTNLFKYKGLNGKRTPGLRSKICIARGSVDQEP